MENSAGANSNFTTPFACADYSAVGRMLSVLPAWPSRSQLSLGWDDQVLSLPQRGYYPELLAGGSSFVG